MSTHDHLERMCRTFIESLLASKERHTLCLNLAASDFDAEVFVQKELEIRGQTNVKLEKEPTAKAFASITDALDSGIAIVEFDDLDKHPKCIDHLLAHVKNPEPKGKLIVVSRHWNSDNTDKEIELRRHCLFYQQAAPSKPPKSKN